MTGAANASLEANQLDDKAQGAFYFSALSKLANDLADSDLTQKVVQSAAEKAQTPEQLNAVCDRMRDGAWITIRSPGSTIWASTDFQTRAISASGPKKWPARWMTISWRRQS